jgi:deoxycytidylate deaminase
MKFISPFVDEDEAKEYEESHSAAAILPSKGDLLSGEEMFAVADAIALQSYDYSFQTGVALGRNRDDMYEFVAAAYNAVIPYQSYALHHGNSREKHLSPPGDTNHYDTIHAEMALLVQAVRDGFDLKDTTLFINLLPCPNCARTLSQTNIAGIVYKHDHSDGYAADLLKMCGKKVTRLP